MYKEIPLAGGRTTSGVMRSGDIVLRPCGPNSVFVHAVLDHLQKAAPGLSPAFLGIDPCGREMIGFLPGHVPTDLGSFSDEQCEAAARLIRRLHDALAGLPGLSANQTVCHNDLSPCNFVFCDQTRLPYAMIDFDAASPGNPLDDLAYAMWMWLDIGSDEQDAGFVLRRMQKMAHAYGAPFHFQNFCLRILAQMRRVAACEFPSPEQTRATRNWALSCAEWTSGHLCALADTNTETDNDL